MNRRNFLRFLGKATVASGITVATGLPEIRDIETVQSLPSDIWGTGWEPEIMAKWDSNTWAKFGRDNINGIQYLSIGEKIYVSNEFTSP